MPHVKKNNDAKSACIKQVVKHKLFSQKKSLLSFLQ